METAKESYEGWAIVELMGHRRIAGRVSQAEQYGTAMLRIDIPSQAVACTGASAGWCPVHGDCVCKNPDDKNDENCPLHSKSSSHGEDDEQFQTQFYGGQSIYCLTPTTEEIARGIAARSRPSPVHAWELPKLAGGPHEPCPDCGSNECVCDE